MLNYIADKLCFMSRCNFLFVGDIDSILKMYNTVV